VGAVEAVEADDDRSIDEDRRFDARWDLLCNEPAKLPPVGREGAGTLWPLLLWDVESRTGVLSNVSFQNCFERFLDLGNVQFKIGTHQIQQYNLLRSAGSVGPHHCLQ
jgi:hypothetical protein